MSERLPSVAVVMPVFNAMPYLDVAIASIVSQTHAGFKLLIYDDYSDDGSYECALGWADRDGRISVFRGSRRLGPSGSSNAAMALAEDELVARMDADDIAAPDRLECQIRAFASHPGAVLVGSTFRLIDARGGVIRKETPSRILGKAPPFAHPSIMIRKSAFDAIGGYCSDSDYFEDADLFRRIRSQGEILVIRKPLLDLRFAGQNLRLRDDRLGVLTRIDRLYRPTRAAGDASRRISIMPFYSLAVLHILALERPHLIRLILRHADFRDLPRTVAVVGIIAIADVWPRLARGIGHTLSRLREAIHGPRLGSAEIFRWPPDEGPDAAAPGARVRP